MSAAELPDRPEPFEFDAEWSVTAWRHDDCLDCLDHADNARVMAGVTGSIGGSFLTSDDELVRRGEIPHGARVMRTRVLNERSAR